MQLKRTLSPENQPSGFGILEPKPNTVTRTLPLDFILNLISIILRGKALKFDDPTEITKKISSLTLCLQFRH